MKAHSARQSAVNPSCDDLAATHVSGKRHGSTIGS